MSPVVRIAAWIIAIPLNPTFEAKDFDAKAGLDAKAVIKDSFVLDATINPDFAQVESDEPQITVNQRFEVLFPEKRPFFQENSGYFATPINLVFTRRIADPLYGVRLTGKKGPWSIGTLFADDQSPGESVAPNDPLWGRQAYFGIVRVSREIGKNGSNIGLIYTDRELDTVPNTTCTDDPCITRTNRVGGIDAHFRFNKNWQLDAQAVNSLTRFNDGTSDHGAGYFLYLERTSRNFEFNSMYKDNAPASRRAPDFSSAPTSAGSATLLSAASMLKGSTCSGTARAFTRATSGITTDCASNISRTRTTNGFSATATTSASTRTMATSDCAPPTTRNSPPTSTFRTTSSASSSIASTSTG